MPFTPFHLGPGAVFKAIGGRRFSFMVFGGSQVLMDLEPLVRIILDTDILHGVTHSVPGALAIGAVATLTGKPISSVVLRWLEIPHYPLTWRASALGAFAGTLSHVVLDAIMHADMRPWWPFGSGNPMLGAIGIDRLHLLCVASGAVGALVAAWRYRRYGRS